MARVFCGHSNEVDPAYVRLIGAVLLQAVRDARAQDPFLSLDAVLWLAGPDAPLYLQAVGMADDDPIALLTGRRMRRSSWRWLSDEQ